MNNTENKAKTIIAKILTNAYMLALTFMAMLIVTYGAIWVWHFALKYALGR